MIDTLTNQALLTALINVTYAPRWPKRSIAIEDNTLYIDQTREGTVYVYDKEGEIYLTIEDGCPTYCNDFAEAAVTDENLRYFRVALSQQETRYVTEISRCVALRENFPHLFSQQRCDKEIARYKSYIQQIRILLRGTR